MANPLRGEASIKVDGEALALVLDNDAWVSIERLLDMSYMDVLQTLARDETAGRTPKNGIMRAILWGATRAHHAELTPVNCGDMLMRDAGLHQPLTDVVVQSLKSDERGDAEGGDDASGEAGPGKAPAKTARRTGKRS